MQNAYVESFHGRLREECLAVSWFQNLFDARRKIGAWQIEYNEHRVYGIPRGIFLTRGSARPGRLFCISGDWLGSFVPKL